MSTRSTKSSQTISSSRSMVLVPTPGHRHRQRSKAEILSERLWKIVLVGIFLELAVSLAIWPHMVYRVTAGDWSYIADRDELLYLSWSRDLAMRGEFWLTDAIHPESGSMMHPWWLFGPTGLTAYVLDLKTERIGILWRFLTGAGTAIGLLWAVGCRHGFKWATIGVAAFLFFDPGFSFGQLIYRDLRLLGNCFGNGWNEYPGTPNFLNHLRVATPGLAIPFFLLYLGAMGKVRALPIAQNAVLAGLALGVLFHIYFYFWTAAVLGLLVAIVLDASARKPFAITLGVGSLAGFPAILANMYIKGTTPKDWLERTEKFVASGHFENLLLPVPLIIGLGFTGWYVLRKRHDLIFLWTTSLAAFSAMNHQLFTGLQVENFHWHQVAGLTISVLWGRLALEWVEQKPFRLKVLAGLVIAQVLLSFGFRTIESVRTQESLECLDIHKSLKHERLRIPGFTVIGGDIKAQSVLAAFSQTYPLSGRLVDFSSKATNEELDKRLVLNLWLSGLTQEQAKKDLEHPEGLGNWHEAYARRPADSAIRVPRRQELVGQVWSNPSKFLGEFRVEYVILTTDADASNIRSFADQVQTETRYQLWKIREEFLPKASKNPAPKPAQNLKKITSPVAESVRRVRD